MAETYTISEEMAQLKKEGEVAVAHQKRRHNDWDDNYELYRNKVKTNRLTQRQAVNIPLMKETVQTLLSKIDEAPDVEWKELGGDLEKQIIMQEKWNHDAERLNFEGIDIQDKKTVLLYGRGFKKLNWTDDFSLTALDIYDVVIDPYVDPLDIETARFLRHQNIFRTVRQVLADPRYEKKAKDELKQYLNTSEAILTFGENTEQMKDRQERMKAMGVSDSEIDKWPASDTVLNLCEHYRKVLNPKTNKFEWWVYTYANESVILLKEKLSDLIGVDFLPFVTWGQDIETQDIWSDGPGDLVRTPNKVLNVWFSQMIENRTLKNFQMHWYDATTPGYVPQTYEPGPGRMLPAPGNPPQTIMPVEISGLDDTMQQIQYLIKLVESGTAATATDKGEIAPSRTTLGEVELSVGRAMERTLSMAKFYRRAWLEMANKWYRMREANESGKMTLYKLSAKGKIWPVTVSTNDWKSKFGYKAIVKSSSELENEKTKGLQRFMFLKQQFPNNLALNKIVQGRSLELVDFSSEEIKQVQDYEDKIMRQQQMMPQEQPVNPEIQQLGQSVEQMRDALMPQQ